MPNLVRGSDVASCGHTGPGAATVTSSGGKVSRVLVDTKAGLIIGPGAQTVFVEGEKASIVGDAIAGHGIFLHAVPFCTIGDPTVNVGTGFVGDGPEDSFVEDPVDMTIESFTQTIPVIPNIPTSSPRDYLGPLSFTVGIKTTGTPTPGTSFSVGLYELEGTLFPIFLAAGIFISEVAPPVPGFTIDRKEVKTIVVPFSGLSTVTTMTFNLDAELVKYNKPRYFAIGLDIYNNLGETDELNVSPVVTVSV